MIKIKLRLYNLSFKNYAGCQDCRILREMNEQLKKMFGDLNLSVSQIEVKVSSIPTEEPSGFFVNTINHLTSKFEDLAARVNQIDEGRVKVHFKSEKS